VAAAVIVGASLAGVLQLSVAIAPANATAVVQYYVTKGGSGSACSKAHPCKSLSTATNDAFSSGNLGKNVVIHIAAGTFETNVCMFEMSNACSANKPSGFNSLLIEGASASRTILDGTKRATVLAIGVDVATVTLKALTVENGGHAISGMGGGLQIGGNTVNLIDTRFTSNTATSSGGAIQVDGGTLSVQDSTLSGNSVTASGSGAGGAIDIVSNGHALIENSTLSQNTVTVTSPNPQGATGGAIATSDNTTSPLKVLYSTIANNTAIGNPEGGGIFVNDGQVDVIGSTISGNSAVGGAGGGLYSAPSSTIQIGGSILSGNTVATCHAASGGHITDRGYNLADDESCGLGSKSKVTTGSAIALQNLASNGGPTRTERILKTSAAHDFFPKAASVVGYQLCKEADQRGVPRQQGPAAHCDSGAYQFAPSVITSLSPNDGAPGTKVTVKGYGFDFLAVTIHAARVAFAVSKFDVLTTTVPSVPPGSTQISLKNVDGTFASPFTVFAALKVTTSSLPNGKVGKAYSAQLKASGGESPYAWRLTSGHLPAGLHLSGSGHLSGKPSTAGRSSFTVAVTDANALTRKQPLSIVIKR
jgi:predicted outer membrane repeat protein